MSKDADVQHWAKDVKAIDERAVATAGPDPSLPAAKHEAARRKVQQALEPAGCALRTPRFAFASLL